MDTPVNDSTIDMRDFCRVSNAALKKVTSKDRRPVIVNGRMLFSDKSPVVLFTSNFTVHSALGLKDPKSPECTQEQTGVFLAQIEQIMTEFENKYSVLNPRARTNSGEATVLYDTDHFTNAIVIQSQTYAALLDYCLKATNLQFSPTVQALVNDFMTEYLINYYMLYNLLFTRRILSRHMSSATKGHLVGGLFEPLVVGTKMLPSPLLFTSNNWFTEMFSTDSTSIEQLSSKLDSSANRLDLNCTAMCDISKIFNTPVVIDLHNRDWMFMVLCGLLEAIGSGDTVQRMMPMVQAYPTVYYRVMDEQEPRRRALFANLLHTCYSKNTGIAVR